MPTEAVAALPGLCAWAAEQLRVSVRVRVRVRARARVRLRVSVTEPLA